MGKVPTAPPESALSAAPRNGNFDCAMLLVAILNSHSCRVTVQVSDVRLTFDGFTTGIANEYLRISALRTYTINNAGAYHSPSCSFSEVKRDWDALSFQQRRQVIATT